MSLAVPERTLMTNPATYASDLQTKTKTARSRRRHHRHRQKLCTTQRLPAFFAWMLLLLPSFTYWIFIFPEILVFIPHLLPIPIAHCIFFVLLCANFILATFMDPVCKSMNELRLIQLTLFLNFPRVSMNSQQKSSISMRLSISAQSS